MRSRVVVVSIDGAQASTVRRGDFFAAPRSLRSPGSGVRDLATVYPSSTASAHASMLTGSLPSEHGIVGNRYWTQETVSAIRAAADDPLASFHPYEHSSLQVASLLDWCRNVGLSTASAHFPQTISRSEAMTNPGYYCLYAPPRTVEVPAARSAGASGVVLNYFGSSVRLDVHLHRTGALLQSSGVRLELKADTPARLSVGIAPGLLSVPVTLTSTSTNRAVLLMSKASLVLHPNGLDAAVIAADGGPSAMGISYSDCEGGSFVEAPTSAWVADTACRIIDRHDPDVFFLRFNQTDHVQEFLCWQQQRGTEAESKEADEQILQTYADVAGHLAAVVRSLGPNTQVVLFSDHGIDWVDTHLRPNAVLDQLGLTDRMVFQGDSTCAFLYADEPLGFHERRQLVDGLVTLGPGVRVLGPEEIQVLGLPASSNRTGRLILGCGRHAEFVYSGSLVREQVRSASHGFNPRVAEMTGFFRTFGPARLPVDQPNSLIEVAAVVRAACRQVLGVRKRPTARSTAWGANGAAASRPSSR